VSQTICEQELMKMLLKSGIYHGIATHSENMVRRNRIRAKREDCGFSL
jgi:hypothetical protein